MEETKEEHKQEMEFEEVFEIPPEMQYGLSPRGVTEIDWDKLDYSNWSTEYVSQQFQGDYSHIPGFEEVLMQMADKLKHCRLEGWIVNEKSMLIADEQKDGEIEA